MIRKPQDRFKKGEPPNSITPLEQRKQARPVKSNFSRPTPVPLEVKSVGTGIRWNRNSVHIPRVFVPGIIVSPKRDK